MAYEDYSGSTVAKTALLTNIKNMLTELYTTYVTEIEAARGTDVDLDTRLDGFDSDIALLGNAELPGQTGNTGKYLTTNGTVSSWADVQDGLPTQTGNSGKFLTTDGTDVAWGALSSSGTSSGAVDVTLTSASSNVQSITITAADKFVILPDATTLSEGADTFILNNEGNFRFGVKNSAGTFICSIPPNGIGRLSLLDNSTAAGTWKVSDGADLIMNRLKTVCGADAATTYYSSCRLTSTTVFAAWQGTDGDGFCAVLTWTGSAITVSNILEFNTSDASYLSCCRMTDTVAIIGYTGVDSDGFCTAITYDGVDTLVATDTHEFKDAGTILYISVVPIYAHATTGKIGVFYQDTNLYAQVLNWTGTEITANTAETAIRDAASTYISATLLSGAVDSASILVQYIDNTILYAKQVAWNGTTLTPHIASGTVGTQIQAADSLFNASIALNSSYAVLFVFRRAPTTLADTGVFANLVYWSGSAITVKRALIVGHNYASSLYFDQTAAQLVDSDTILFAMDDNGLGHTSFYKIKAVGATSSKDCILEVQGKIDIGYGPSTLNYRTTAILDSTGGFFIYRDADADSYTTAQRIDVGA